MNGDAMDDTVAFQPADAAKTRTSDELSSNAFVLTVWHRLILLLTH